MNRPIYRIVSGGRRIIVSVLLPKGDIRWVRVSRTGREYGQGEMRLYPDSRPVGIHVIGSRELIDFLAKTGRMVKGSLKLVLKTSASGYTTIFINLYLVKPGTTVTHNVELVEALEGGRDLYTTSDMRGVGIKLTRVRTPR